MHGFQFPILVALHITQIFALPSLANLASTNASHDSVDIGSESEYRVPGLTNLYWQPTVISPPIQLKTIDVLHVLTRFQNRVLQHLPQEKALNKFRFAHIEGVMIRVAPSEVGPGLVQRQDPHFIITNHEMLKWMKNMRDTIVAQHTSFTPAVTFRLFEKDTPERRSRGTVAIGSITANPPPGLE